MINGSKIDLIMKLDWPDFAVHAHANQINQLKPVPVRVARWFHFRPKMPVWVYFGGPWNGKCCNIYRSFGIFYDH
jgi:hypothetical protein